MSGSNGLKPFRSIVWLLLAYLLLPPAAQAEEPAAPVATQPTATQPIATHPAPPVRPELTAEMIQNWIQEVQQRADLDDPTKSKIVGLYQQAIQQLETAQKWKTAAAAFELEAQQAPAELAVIATQPAPPETAPASSPLNDKTLAQLDQELVRARAQLSESRKLLDQYENEPKRRANRRTEIAQLTTAARQKLEEITAQLAASADVHEPPSLAQAERTLARARGRALRAELSAYEKEIANFDATAALVTARRDLAARLLSRADKNVKELQEAVNQKRREEAEKQQREAQQALQARANAHPLVRAVAEENAKLVERTTQLAPKIEHATKRADEIAKTLDQVKKDFQTVRDKVNAGGVTQALGLLLRQLRASLPNVREARRSIRVLQEENASVELALVDLRKQSNDLARITPEEELASILNRLDPATPPDERREIARALKGGEDRSESLLVKRREYLASLISEYESYFRSLIAHQEAEEQLIKAVETYADYIDEHILWLRSHPGLDPSCLSDAWHAFCWMVAPRNWRHAAAALADDFRGNPLRFSATLLLFVGLFMLHRTIGHRLATLGSKASQRTCSSFAPTARAVADTVLLVVPWPLLLWFLAWRLSASGNGEESEFIRAVAAGLRTVALALLTAEGFRQVCRAHGLAHAHLDWSPAALKLVRHQLLWLMVVGLPIAFVVAAIEAQENSAWEGSLGRIAFIVGQLALTVFTARVLHPRSGVPREYLASNRHGRLDRLRHFWYVPSVAVPVLLALLAGLGFYYTALELTWRLQATAWFILGMVVLRGLILRWVLLARRKLAIAQARKRLAERKAREEAQAEGVPVTEEASAPEPDIDLSAVNIQTRRLFGGIVALASFVGLWLIWVDVLPALGLIGNIRPWPDAPITVGRLALAALAIITTVIVTRNVPGFLEITLLRRLPLDAGQRYAIVTVFKYLVTAIGVIATCECLGIGWSKVQWLVAAITVGLGFGLQEIFANFVSGLIILLERPIRIGDTVTIGEVSGTVSRIRIRATTITGWDRKELIIPNKEFVTGKVINWTLSDSVLRVVIPVGVAYGSDTDQTECLLRKAAEENPLVLRDPAPVVLFNEFGDNALNFELRVYVASVDHVLQVRHDLHRAIDRAFRQAGIEIAFPQRDIHIRSVQDVFHLVDQRRETRPT